jgi:hypothetical protein
MMRSIITISELDASIKAQIFKYYLNKSNFFVARHLEGPETAFSLLQDNSQILSDLSKIETYSVWAYADNLANPLFEKWLKHNYLQPSDYVMAESGTMNLEQSIKELTSIPLSGNTFNIIGEFLRNKVTIRENQILFTMTMDEFESARRNIGDFFHLQAYTRGCSIQGVLSDTLRSWVFTLAQFHKTDENVTPHLYPIVLVESETEVLYLGRDEMYLYLNDDELATLRQIIGHPISLVEPIQEVLWNENKFSLTVEFLMFGF